MSAAIQRVRAGDGGQKLRNDIQAFALDLTEDPAKVDFEVRRAALRTFRDIPEEEWAEICRRSGVGKGRVGVRSQQAAAWLWSELMQADARTSPALRELREASSHADVVYKKFVRELIPSLSKELAAFGFRYLHLPPTSNSGMHVPNRALYANNDVEAPHGASHPTTH